MDAFEFIAEIKETKQAKKASLDQEYSVRFVTDNPQVLDLGKLPYDTIVKVAITIPSSRSPDRTVSQEVESADDRDSEKIPAELHRIK